MASGSQGATMRGSSRGRGRGGVPAPSTPSHPTSTPDSASVQVTTPMRAMSASTLARKLRSLPPDDNTSTPSEGRPAKRLKSNLVMTLGCRFPLPSSTQGKEFVTVTVGGDQDCRDFAVHKALLCAASDYFSAALTGNFAEAQRNTLALKEHCPMAFEVLYQYIYTGQVLPAPYYTNFRIKSDLLWLRTLKLADATMVEDLKMAAYRCLREHFSSVLPVPPSKPFVDELFDEECPRVGLQSYLVAHAADWINNEKMKDWRAWSDVMEKNLAYGAAVSVQLTKVVSKTYTGSRLHPNECKSFVPDVLFPSPAPEETPKEREDCLFKADCGKAAKITSEEPEVGLETPFSEWDSQARGVLRLFKNLETGNCRVTYYAEVDSTGNAELLHNVEHISMFDAKSGIVRGHFYNINEKQSQMWAFCLNKPGMALDFDVLMKDIRDA